MIICPTIYYCHPGQEILLPVGAVRLQGQADGWWVGEDIPHLPFGQRRVKGGVFIVEEDLSDPSFYVEVVILHNVNEGLPGAIPALLIGIGEAAPLAVPSKSAYRTLTAEATCPHCGCGRDFRQSWVAVEGCYFCDTAIRSPFSMSPS